VGRADGPPSPSRFPASGRPGPAVRRGLTGALGGAGRWQGGAFRCRPRDRWIGWKPERRFRRLDLIANGTRFLVLAGPGVRQDPASSFLTAMTRRLADDWLAVHGHRVLLAGTFVDPAAIPDSLNVGAATTVAGGLQGRAAPVAHG